MYEIYIHLCALKDHVTSDPDMLLKLKLDPLRWNQGLKISMILSLYNAVQV